MKKNKIRETRCCFCNAVQASYAGPIICPYCAQTQMFNSFNSSFSLFANESMFLHLLWTFINIFSCCIPQSVLGFLPSERGLPPLSLTALCPWDFINIISSSGAADMEQRAAINYSSLVLAPCLGIHTARSLLCRFGAVHDPKTSLSHTHTLAVCGFVCVVLVLL